MISGQESEGIVCCRDDTDLPLPPLLYRPHQKPGWEGSNLAIEIQTGGGHEVPDDSNYLVSFVVCCKGKGAKTRNVTSVLEDWAPLTQNWYTGRSLPKRLIVISPEGEANLEAMSIQVLKEYKLCNEADGIYHWQDNSGGSAIIAICFH